jgi:hypothetical protein
MQKPAKASFVRQPKKVYGQMIGMGAKSITIVRAALPFRLHPLIYPVTIELKSKSKSKSKLYYDRVSVGQAVLVSGTHLGPAINFSSPFVC